MKKIILILALSFLGIGLFSQDMEQVKRRVVMEKIAEEATLPEVTEFKTKEGELHYTVYVGLITTAEVFAKAGYDSYELTKTYQAAMKEKENYLKAEDKTPEKKK